MGGREGVTAPYEKCAPLVQPPHFGPAFLDFHLNRPVISLIQLHIVPPAPSWNCAPHWPSPIWLVPETAPDESLI